MGSLSLVLVIAGLLAPPAYATVPKGSFSKDNNGSGSIIFSGCSGGADGTKSITITRAFVTISAPDSMGISTASGGFTITGGATGDISFTGLKLNSNGGIITMTGSWTSSNLKSMGIAVGTANGDFNSGFIFSPVPSGETEADQNQLELQMVNGIGSSTNCSSINFNIDALLMRDSSTVGENSDTLAAASNDIVGVALDALTVAILNRKADAGFGFTADGLSFNDDTIHVTPFANGGRVSVQSAGDEFEYPWGVWASYSRIDFEDDFAATAYDADTDQVFLGADFSPWDNFVAGVALGYENTDVNSTFNGGGSDSDGFSVIPYLSADLSDQLGTEDYQITFDMALGYGNIDHDQFRTDPTTGTRITGSTSSDRLFVLGNVNAFRGVGDWTFGGRLGLAVARDEMDAFTESDGTLVLARTTQLGRLSVGGDAAYSWGSFQPWAGLTYNHDFEQNEVATAPGTTQPANDDDSVTLDLGVRWYSESGITGSLQYSKELGREDFDSDTFSVQIRADF